MRIIDCKTIASKWKDELKAEKLPAYLCVIQVGEDEASEAYVRGKTRDCTELGYGCIHRHIKADNRAQVLDDVLNAIYLAEIDNCINGIIVQLPLPFGLTFDNIKHAIPYEKDVDGFLAQSPFSPCTPGGIMELLRECDIGVRGKKVVIVGRSNIVGKPLAQLMTEADATVTLCHSKTPLVMLKNELSSADIVVSAVGHYGVFSTEDCKKNAVIIDVGINRNKERLCGDVEIYENSEVSITPVPGGIGLITRAMLMRNLAQAYKNQNGVE